MYIDRKLLSASLTEPYSPYIQIYGGIPTYQVFSLKPFEEKLKNLCQFPNPFSNTLSDLHSKNYRAYFQTLLEAHKYLYLAAEFKTQFKNKQYQGNYGLKLQLWTGEQESDFIELKFDIESFNGDPYDFKYFTHQGAFIDISCLAKKTYGIKKIDLFYDDEVQGGNIAQNLTVTDFIEISHLILDFIPNDQLKDYNSYNCVLNSSKEKIFRVEQDSIEFFPTLSFNNIDLKNVIGNTNWYYRDNTINFNSLEYDPLAGQGWRKFFPNESKTINTEKLFITLNDEKVKKYFNYTKLPNGIICEEDIKCIFQYKKYNNYFETPEVTIKNEFDIKNNYNFQIKENTSFAGDGIEDFSATLSLIGDFPLLDLGYEKLEVKWYWVENGWIYEGENTQLIETDVGKLVPVPNDPDKENYYLSTEEDEINVLSKIDILKKVAYWEGNLQIYCDIYGIKKEGKFDIENSYLLAHRSFNYQKTISQSEFNLFLTNYLEDVADDETSSNFAKNEIKYCIDNKIFSGSDGKYQWKRWITQEELASIIYNAFAEQVDIADKERLNPYFKTIKSHLDTYLKELSNIAPSSYGKQVWNGYIEKNYITDGRPKTWATKEEAIQLIFKIIEGELLLAE